MSHWVWDTPHKYTMLQDISTGAVATRIHNLQNQQKKKKKNPVKEEVGHFFYSPQNITNSSTRLTVRKTGKADKREAQTQQENC